MSENIYNIMEKAQNSGMNLVEYLRHNYSSDDLNALQTKVNSELKAREPVISGFRETYTRTSETFDMSTMNPDELDALQDDVNRGLAERRDELALMRGDYLSSVIIDEAAEEMAIA